MLLKVMYISYHLGILSSLNPEIQLKDTKSAVKNKPKDLLTQLKSFIFLTALVLVFKKNRKLCKTKYDIFYSHTKAKAIINESEISGVFESFYTKVIPKKQIFVGKV